MKIKRTFAPTMREALNIVKKEQGDDAVILGNNKVPGGVEIISAIDYDQARINAESALSSVTQQNASYSSFASAPTIPRSNPSVQSTPATRVTESVTHQSINTVESTSVEQLNRLEPVFGDLDFGPATSKKPVKVRNSYPTTAPKNPQKTSFDWQSSAAPKAEDTIEFNGKAHAQKLLDAIKNTQTEQFVKTNEGLSQLDLSSSEKQKTVTQEVAPTVEAEAEKAETQIAVEVKKEATEEVVTTAVIVDAVQPALTEMKDEMRHLRQLMQSQLTSLDWDKYKQRNPLRTVLLNLLTELGIGADVCERLVNQMDIANDDPQLMWRQAMGVLSKMLPTNNSRILEEGGVVALVGSTGVGKTTTIAKMAARFAHEHGKRSVALISTDNFRIGAQEQLQQYAKLLQIPLLTSNSSDELADRLTMLSDKKLVLIDTTGVSQNDMKLSEQFHSLQKDSPQIQPLLVMSANTQLAALNQTIINFEKVRLAGSIITKVDEAASLGGVITASIRHHLPINFCGLGQQVPEDFETAKSNRLISKAVTLMQQYKETPNAETMAMRFNKVVAFGQ